MAGCWVMPRIVVQLGTDPQIGDSRLSKICKVVERPGHHGAGNLVNFNNQLTQLVTVMLKFDIVL